MVVLRAVTLPTAGGKGPRNTSTSLVPHRRVSPTTEVSQGACAGGSVSAVGAAPRATGISSVLTRGKKTGTGANGTALVSKAVAGGKVAPGLGVPALLTGVVALVAVLFGLWMVWSKGPAVLLV